MDSGIRRHHRRAPLHLHVCERNVDRALRIWDRLIIGLQQRGHRVFSESKGEDNRLFAEILDVKFEIGVFEAIKPITRTPGKNIWEEKYVSTGLLGLSAEFQRYYYLTIVESERKPLELRLNEFISALLRVVPLMKATADELGRLKREEEEKLRAEERRRDLVEFYKNLEEQVKLWTKSKRIRAFVEAWRQEGIRIVGEINPQSEFARRIALAEEYADSFDPLSGLKRTPSKQQATQDYCI